jgi:hypothetical protein
MSSASTPSTDDSDNHSWESDSQSWNSEEGEEDALARPARRRQSTAAAAGRRSRTVRQVPGDTSEPLAVARTGLGTAAQAAAAAAVGPDMQHTLHQPYSQFVVCESTLQKTLSSIACHLCTDLAELHSEGICAAYVSVVVHPAGWSDSEDCRSYILQQQHPNAAQQQQQQAGISLDGGPYQASLKKQGRSFWITALKHGGKLTPYRQRSTPYTLVLQERVSSCSRARPGPALHR